MSKTATSSSGAAKLHAACHRRGRDHIPVVPVFLFAVGYHTRETTFVGDVETTLASHETRERIIALMQTLSAESLPIVEAFVRFVQAQ